MAGSQVFKLHGVRTGILPRLSSFLWLNCLSGPQGPVPHCLDTNGKVVKPGSDLSYEKSLDMDVFSKAAQAIRQADLLIIGGDFLSCFILQLA